MNLTKDESRALLFVGLLLLLAGGARVARREPAVKWPADAVDIDSLEAVARDRLEDKEQRSRPLAKGERVDPNTASEEDLDRLPGVGPALAGRILAEREEGGPFRSLDDLTRVPGIGARLAQRLAPHLALPPAPRDPFGGRADRRADRRAGARPGEGAGSQAGGGAGGRAGGRTQALVDLNHATAAELETLPGIGSALAQRIIAYRDSIGRFRTVDELEGVSGIGQATIKRLRSRLEVKP